MPIESELPVIDDRRFDELMSEVRARIARYTPEWKPVWTDVNDSDPGITLVQLFAWLTETLIYRVNRVPAMSYLKFLQLIGIELQPAEAARTELTFPVKATHSTSSVIVPLRTRVSAEDPNGGAPIIFETERAFTALRAQLASLQAFDGYAFLPVTQDNTDAVTGFEPFGPSPVDGAALLFGFDDSAELPAAELSLFFFAREAGGGLVSCNIPRGAAYAPARLRWEYWDGADWTALSVLRDDSRAGTRTGLVQLKLPAPGRMQRVVIGGEPRSLFWLRARVERAQYEKTPVLLAVRANTVSALQVETVRDEVLGGSNGRRDQVFRLSRSPVLAGSLALEIDEGSGFEAWHEVGDFFGSTPTDAHYVVNRTTGDVRFGNGDQGRIPTGNPRNAGGNVVARAYRVGGGKSGNVLAKAAKTLVETVMGIDDANVGNLFAAVGGSDEETLDAAKKRAPQVIRSGGRAVTAIDFEQAAADVPGIRRAKALPLHHPDFPGVAVPGAVSVIVVPDGDGPSPLPSDGTLRTVCACLEQRRLLTTELYVLAPRYQTVAVSGEVVVQGDADIAAVKRGVDEIVASYFHPLTGGEDGLGWPFGGTIFYSRLYQKVFGVPGVDSIVKLLITLDGEEQPACTDVRVDAGALLAAHEPNIDVHYPPDEELS